MFNKKQCAKCGNKLNSNYDFCPSCGNQIKQNSDDWGMLGKNDFVQEQTNPFQNMLGGLGGGMLGKMLGSAMNMLEKEMQKEMRNQQTNQSQNPNQNLNPNFQLFVNGKKVDPSKIKVTQQRIPQQQIPQQQVPTKTLPIFSQKTKEKFQKLSKQEPATEVRRFADQIIYEIDLPGVKSINDISIRKVQKSIEIKAIANSKAYFKVLEIDLPIINYELEQEKLILELGTKD